MSALYYAGSDCRLRSIIYIYARFGIHVIKFICFSIEDHQVYYLFIYLLYFCIEYKEK